MDKSYELVIELMEQFSFKELSVDSVKHLPEEQFRQIQCIKARLDYLFDDNTVKFYNLQH